MATTTTTVTYPEEEKMTAVSAPASSDQFGRTNSSTQDADGLKMATSASSKVVQPRNSVTGFKLWLQQTRALLYKQVLVSLRNPVATALQIFSSLFFMLLVFGISKSFDNRNTTKQPTKDVPNPEIVAAPPIPNCDQMTYRNTDVPCYDFVWAPNTSSVVAGIVQQIMANNDPPIPSNRVLGFASGADIDAYLQKNQQTVNGGLTFAVLSNISIGYGIQTNSTSKFFHGVFEDPNFFVQVPLQSAAEREITRYLRNDPGLAWNLSTCEMAHPPLFSYSVVGPVAAAFILAAAMFGFVIQISNLVTERENKLRQGLRTMGLQDSPYWTSWLIWETMMAALFALFVVLFGMMFQLSMFLHNSFLVSFFLLFLFSLTMTGIAFTFSAFIRKSSTATNVGFFIYIIAFILQIVVAFGFPFYLKEKNYWRYIFAAIPPALLAKGLADLASATVTPGLPGISLSNVMNYCDQYPFTTNDVCLPAYSIGSIYYIFLIEFAIWFLLALYFDNVLKDENGNRKPFYYFLTPAYWTGRGHGPSEAKLEARLAKYNFPPPKDEDVLEENQRVRASPLGSSLVEVRGLVKAFKKFQAVKGNFFSVERGELFCLLGPNGAGKTTTINMLTGVAPPSAGNAMVAGFSLLGAGGLPSIRKLMGVCPQFDILWPKLTGAENLRVFAMVKGLPSGQVKEEVQKLLERVKLDDSSKMQSGRYSGGMRRRLSVAVALIGDPTVVYLDEPTTGMDPISRRYVWDIIEQAKPGRSIILTTHSMEEADILGDRIAIMARGELRCIGSSIRLKNKFGAGYCMSIGVDDASSLPNVKQFFRQNLGIEPSDEIGTYLQYVLPRSAEGTLPAFVRLLKNSQSALGVSDIQLSLTTLDEVFLRIAKEAEIENAGQSKAIKVDIALPSGEHTSVLVPLGQDLVFAGGASPEAPNGYEATIRWAQDENGTLTVGDYTLRLAVPNQTGYNAI